MQASNDGIDRISTLPESILTKILSLLPTEEAIATSILSSSWKFKWKNIYNLTFDELMLTRHLTSHEICTSFAFIVNKILTSLNQQSIEKFSISVYTMSKLYDVTSWIAVAVSRNAKVIKFETEYSDSDDDSDDFEMPCSLFTCKTLEYLCISSSNVKLNLPSFVCLPNLQTLSLSCVRYECDASVRELISGCSSLETLYIHRTCYDNVVTFTISSPTLRDLTLMFYDQAKECFFVDENDYKLEVNAPRLNHLSLWDDISMYFNIENICLLDKAFIHLERLFGSNERYIGVTSLFKVLYNVENLSFDYGEEVKLFSHATTLKSFPRLSQLEFETIGWEELLHFMERSDKLEVVTMSECYLEKRCWIEPEKVPICLLSSLKTMYLGKVESVGDDELAMIAYILKNAKVLKTMTIRPFDYLDHNHRLQVYKELFKFPRGSEECELHIDDW